MTTLHTTHLHNDYLDGILSDEDTIIVDKHLNECRDCRRDLEKLRRLVSSLGSFQAPDPGQEYFQNFSDKIAARTVLAEKNTAAPRNFTGSRNYRQEILKTLIRLAAVVTLLFISFYISNIKGEKDATRWAEKISDSDFAAGDSVASTDLLIEPLTGINRVGTPSPVEDSQSTVSETLK